MTQFYVRIDEHHKTPQQIAQREATYEAAKVLRRDGYDVEVVEHFTGSSKRADAASIHIKLRD
jgi:hypothetical protein